MAEVNQENGLGKNGGGRPRQKKKSTRVDMTAMVDVAFLLLTFFILTTTMGQPYVMEVNKPPLSDGAPVVEGKVMTLVLGADDQVHYWVGTDGESVQTVGFDGDGIRKVIVGHLNKEGNRCRGKEVHGCWDPMFVIKPYKSSRYKNLVDILDEMAINGVSKYALGDIEAADSVLLAGHHLL